MRSLGALWPSEERGSQIQKVRKYGIANFEVGGWMSPQIVLYALPTSPKNTFINFCGDLRQVLTMGKLMVHPRFWPKPPKCENNDILIFENLKNLNFVFCPSGPAEWFPGGPGDRQELFLAARKPGEGPQRVWGKRKF